MMNCSNEFENNNNLNYNATYQLCNPTNRREIERFVIKHFLLFIILIVIYEIISQYVIHLRKQKWEKATPEEIVDTLLDIIYMCDKYVWELTARLPGGIRKNNVSYDDICEAIDYLSDSEEMVFWKYAKQMGLYDKMQDMIRNYKKMPQLLQK